MTTRIPPMQALRAFEATARTGSLTAAAESLHLTHGAISHQIKALEEELGVELIARAGRGIRLTDAGERFALRIRGALSDITSAVREMTEAANPRRLSVSVVPSFAARWLLPRMRQFMTEHPDIDLDVRAAMGLVDFRREDVHLAIRYGAGNWPGVNAEFLMEDQFFPVCSPRIAHGVPKRPQDLSRYTLLRSDDEFWKPWFVAAGLDWPEPTRGPIFNDSAHMLQAAAEGHGIALGRRSLVGMDLENGTLVQPFGITVPSPRKFYLVYPPSFANSPKLAAFRDWILEEIGATRSPAQVKPRRSTKRRAQ